MFSDGNWAYSNGYANDGSAAGDGNGFKLGGARAGTNGTSGGHTVTDNVAWGNRAIGFDENSASDPITLENNTAYNNGLYNYGFWEGEHTFRNNLSAGTGRVAASGSSEGNSWTMPVKVDSSDFLSLDGNITARGERAADGSLPTTQFLHLAAGSDLVNLGAFQGASRLPRASRLLRVRRRRLLRLRASRLLATFRLLSANPTTTRTRCLSTAMVAPTRSSEPRVPN